MTPEEEAAAKAAASAATPPATPPAPKTYDEDYVARLRREKQESDTLAATLKKEKEDREAADAKARGDQEALTKIEKKRADDLQAQLNDVMSKGKQRVLKSELRTEALAAGIADIDDVALIDVSQVAFDADGEPIGIKELVAKFKELKPGKFKLSDEAAAKAAAEKKKADDEAAERARKGLPAQNSTPPVKKPVEQMTDAEFDREWAAAGKL